MAGYFNFGDPILMALLQAVYRSPQQIPQSLQQGAVQPLPAPDPTFGLNQSPQYLNSTPVEQSLSRGANVRDLSIQSGLANNPEDVYAAGIRNEQPDLIELARAAMERYGLQSKLQSAENIAQTNAQADVQKAIAPAEIAAEASQRNKLVELEMEKLRQAGASAKSDQERITRLTNQWLDGRAKIANNENIAAQDKSAALTDYDNAFRSQLQNTAASQSSPELGSDQHVTGMKSQLERYMTTPAVTKPSVGGGSQFKEQPAVNVVPPPGKIQDAKNIAIQIVATMKFKEGKTSDQIVAETNANPNVPPEIKKLVEFYAKQYK